MRTQWPARVVSLALALTMGTPAAYADDAALTRAQAQIDDANSRFESASAEYQAAKDAMTDLEAQIAQNEEDKAHIEEQLPAQRERTAASIKTLYRFQQSAGDLLDLVLTSDSFDEFIATAHYLDTILDRNVAEVNALASMENELAQTQAELAAQRDAAEQKRSEADKALEGASSALQDARAHKRELEEAQAREKAAEDAEQSMGASATVAPNTPQGQTTAQPQAVEQNEPVVAPTDVQDAAQPAQTQATEDRQTATPAETQSSEDQTPGQEQPAEQPQPVTEPTTEPTAEPTPEPEAVTPEQTESTETATVSSDVADWAARIDAYLVGSPLAGYGAVFAQAAADYGVDPRISPAISCIESGKGSVCFLPHNAWGWGSASWPDWESAIRGHVSGFASIYGSTLTLSGAKMYASNDIYEYWYSLVQSEMASI